MQMKKLRCDKPHDIDEARKKKGTPAPQAQGLAHHGPRADHPRARGVPNVFRREEEAHSHGVRLNRKDDLKSQVEAFEDEKNAVLERGLEERG